MNLPPMPTGLTSRLLMALTWATVCWGGACFKAQDDYDRSCTGAEDCVLLAGHCGCPIGAINASEQAHAERDYTAAVLPVVLMIDCGGMGPCATLNAQVQCVDNTCTMTQPDGGAGDGGGTADGG